MEIYTNLTLAHARLRITRMWRMTERIWGDSQLCASKRKIRGFAKHRRKKDSWRFVLKIKEGWGGRLALNI
mgnify:CR=1 FL=1